MVVCDKVVFVCERWCGERLSETKMCVKDGMTKMVCGKDGVTKMVCDKVVCERWCVKDGV